MIHITEILSKFIANLKYDDLSLETIETTKMYIIDYYASCFAGIKVNRKFNKAIEEVLFEIGGREEASVFYSDKRLPVMDAAFLNAVYSHGADMDDGNRKAMGHVAAHVMSSVFALAENLNSTGRDIIVAINAGYEVYNRVAAAAQPGLVRRGFHSTGTAGAIACGAAAAKILGLDEKQIYNAISLSAIQSSGLMLITESGQSCKPINPANAARVGILSAKLACRGVESSKYPLESKKGWFHAMSDNVDEGMVTEGLGETFTICESYLKPYPSCRHTHCGIEGAIQIRKQMIEKYGNIKVNLIDRIEVHIYRNAIQIAGQITIPETAEDSKFSIHYSLATALVEGNFNLSDLALNNINDEKRTIIDKIVLIEDASMENTKEGIRGAKVLVRMKDGTEFMSHITIPKGDAANPFSWEDMRKKMSGCAENIITDKQQKRLFKTINSFETIEKFQSVNTLFDE